MKKETIKSKDFVKRYAQKMACDEETAKKFLDGFVNTVLEAMQNREPITLENFGKFHIEDKKDSTVFKFIASQKLKAILGWSSTYRSS